MINLTHPLPDNNKFFLACSGGIDSMAALHWLSRGGRLPYGIIHIHHNTGEYADRALEFVSSIYQNYCFDLFVKKVKGNPPKGVSKESWWREQRYKLIQDVLDTCNKGYPVILAHNLDDCVEQYIINSLIRFRRREVINYYGPSSTIRPFRTWKRSKILKYVTDIKLKWIEDPSNKDIKYQRNRIRHEILPKILEMNPGLYSFVKRLVMEDSIKETQEVMQ